MTRKSSPDASPATLLTHRGSAPGSFHGAVSVPPHRMSTIVFKDYAAFERADQAPYHYGRAGTPSTGAFEEIIASLEGAAGSVATCSGLSAIVTSLMAFAAAGDHILMPDNCYGPGRKSCENILRRFGVNVEYYPPLIGDGIRALFRPETRLLFIEAPGSLTFEMPDIPALVAAAKSAGIKTAIDNSWGTPLCFKPLSSEIDVAVMSATKYLSGHSDAMLGVVSGTEETLPALRQTARMLGFCPGSEEIYLASRGLRTLHLRMAQHQRSALGIAAWLQEQPAVKRVLHPALPGSPGHEHWKASFCGSSGTFGIVLHPVAREKIAAMLDGMRLFRIGFSWGGFESLLFPEQPHPIRTASPWNEDGFSLRLHIGLEDQAELQEDLDQGLARLS